MVGEPFIPENITVHLGNPDSDAPDVTVSFPDYVKNVASSEIFPDWPENSLRANIYVIVTYALNRIYTEWYRSKGYDFDITSVTQFDQAYVYGREIFENISLLVDELFDDYLRKDGNIEPFFSSFCNGTTSTCAGLSQWGTVELAERGYVPYDILTYYYGSDIQIVQDAPVRINTLSYSGEPLSQGMASNDVKYMQIRLNRISRNYPSIPKIAEVDGIFGVDTEEAVKQFQRIFNLPVTGIIDKAVWYKISYIYVSVKRLAELNSEGISLDEISKQYSDVLKIGMQSDEVKVLQYYLEVVGSYYERVQPVEVTGYFGNQTEASVKSFQGVFGLPQSGEVDRPTWNALVKAYFGIVENVPIDTAEITVLYPGMVLKEGITSEYVKIIQEYLTVINTVYPDIPAVNNTGYFGPVTKNSVTAFQRHFGLNPTGVVGAVTWDEIASVYSDIKFGFEKKPFQYPGYIIR